MTTIEFLRNQIIETRKYTNRLISELPMDMWFVIPEGTQSNFAWQVGHIMLAQNFHVFSCSLGRNKEIMQKIPLQKYVDVFNGLGAKIRYVKEGLVSAVELKEQMDFVHDACLQELWSAPESLLNEPLEPIPFEHPIAKVKYDAISWSFKHEMWHGAEMEQIKIALNCPTRWIRS